VAGEGLDGVGLRGLEAALRDRPELNVGILRGGGNEELVHGVEVNIEDLSLVAADEGQISLELTLLLEGEDGKSTATAGLQRTARNLVLTLILLESHAERDTFRPS